MSYINNLKTHNGKIGKLGEDFAVEFLKDNEFTVRDRNFRTRIGEIDIVAEKNGKLHIIEVKTSMSNSVAAVENMNYRKIKKVAILASLYAGERLYCIDFIGITLNHNFSLKNIDFLENIEV